MAETELNFTSNTTANQCQVIEEEYIYEKLWLVVICGSFIAICGVIFNLILLISLNWPLKYRHSQNIYLGLLAIFDVGVCACYIPIFSVEILYFYFDSFYLFYAWHMYTPIVFTLSRISQTGTTYTLIAATADRLYFVRASALRQTAQEQRQNSSPLKGRALILFLVVLFTVITRLPMYWELEVRTFHNCTHFAFMYMGLTELAMNPAYNTYFRFWFQHIIQIFAPFLILLSLNISIVYRLRAMEAMAPPLHRLLSRGSTINMIREGTSHSSSKTRKQATRTVAALVTTYLCCNSLGLIIGLLEHINVDFLRKHPTFFTFAVDVNTILHLINSVIRIFLYYKCSSDIRKSLKHLLVSVFGCELKKPSASRATSCNHDASVLNNGPLLGIQSRNGSTTEYQENSNFKFERISSFTGEEDKYSPAKERSKLLQSLEFIDLPLSASNNSDDMNQR